MAVAAVECVDEAKAPCRVSLPGCANRGRRQGVARLRDNVPLNSSREGPTGVEGAGGTGGHGRASRRGAERSEDA